MSIGVALGDVLTTSLIFLESIGSCVLVSSPDIVRRRPCTGETCSQKYGEHGGQCLSESHGGKVQCVTAQWRGQQLHEGHYVSEIVDDGFFGPFHQLCHGSIIIVGQLPTLIQVQTQSGTMRTGSRLRFSQPGHILLEAEESTSQHGESGWD